MVFLLFLGSWVAYEFILRADAKAEKLRKASRPEIAVLPVPPPATGTDHTSLLNLFQAVESHSKPVRPVEDTVQAGSHSVGDSKKSS